MNEASWIAAEPRRSYWSWWWPRRRRGAKPRDRDQGEQRYAVTLVGSFDDPAALLRALQAFSAAAFSAQEVICIPASGPRQGGSVAARLSTFLKRVLGFPSREELGAMQAPLAFRKGMRQVLESGGGLVFVLPASRFQQACQLIHQAGGHVGLRGRQAGSAL